MSMAMKYAMKKRAAKMARGGEAKMQDAEMPSESHSCPTCGQASQGKHDAQAKAMDGQDMDMVDRIMSKRYSEGGMVSAEGEDMYDHLEDSKPNEFDDEALDDHLSFSYTGKNSGDELGNKAHDEDDKDVVSRIMKSRAKKDRMPRPA